MGVGSGRLQQGGLTASDGVYHFHTITFAEGKCRVLTAGYDVFVHFHRHTFAGQCELLNQGGNGGSARELHGFAINLYLHGSNHLCYFFRAAMANSAQPTMKHSPPTGVTGPSQWVPVSTSRYRLPLNSRMGPPEALLRPAALTM